VNDVASHRRAGIAALLAIPALVMSVVFIVLFFRGAGSAFGPLNDLSSILSAGLTAGPTAAHAAAATGANRSGENPFVEGDRNDPPFPLR